MATNPRVPQDFHPKFPKQNKPASPWVAFGIVVAVAMLVAIIYWLPRAPKHATMGPTAANVPVQPVPGQIQLTDLRIVQSPVGNQIYIYGKLANAGQTSINGIQVGVGFQDQAGGTVATNLTKVESFRNNNAQDLVKDPIKPAETREIRIPIEHTPNGWNRKLPSVTVQEVTGVGSATGSK